MTMARQNYSPSSYGGTTRWREGGGKTQGTIKQIGQLKNLADLDIEEITKENGIAESFVLELSGQLKPTQLRKFFDTIVRNQEQIREKGWDAARAEFHMIRPSLAYAKGRKLIPNEFFDLVDTCMKKIPAGTEDQTIKNYDRFVDLMKAIVAYAKYYGKG